MVGRLSNLRTGPAEAAHLLVKPLLEQVVQVESTAAVQGHLSGGTRENAEVSEIGHLPGPSRARSVFLASARRDATVLSGIARMVPISRLVYPWR